MKKKNKKLDLQEEKIGPLKKERLFLQELEEMQKEVLKSPLSEKELDKNIKKIEELKFRVEKIMKRKLELISTGVLNDEDIDG